MALLQEPFLNLSYNETYQSQGWNVWNDENIISCSFYLSATLNGERGSPPGAIYDGAFTFDGALLYDGTASDFVDGRTYLVSSPATGDWVGQEGKLATVVEDGWKFYPPVVGHTIFNTVDESFYLNTGDDFINKDDYGVFPSPFVSCAYPLDASSAELITAGFNGKLTMSGDEQTGTLALGSGSQADGMSVSGLEAGVSIPFNAGAVAVETQFTLPTLTGTTPQVTASMGFYETGVAIGSPVFSVQVAALNTGAFTQAVFIGSTPVYTAAAASGSVRCGARAASGVLRVWFDGVEVSLSSTAVPNVASFPLAFVLKVTGLDAPDTGKTASIQLITNATSMTSPFPSGTTDPCGNTL